MAENHTADQEELDWELSDGYYKEDVKKELSLEDFITEGDIPVESRPFVSPVDAHLAKTIEDVRQVMLLAGKGRTVEQIAAETGLERQYVYDIQVCAQGFREDDQIAVAHLVLG